MIRAFLFTVVLMLGGALAAQEFSALARLEAVASRVVSSPAKTHVEFQLSQGVPFRAFTLAGPPRLVMDFREVDFSGVSPALLLPQSDVSRLRFGVVRPGWSRAVLDLEAPQVLRSATLDVDQTDGKARLRIDLEAVSSDVFKAASGTPPGEGWAEPAVTSVPAVEDSDMLTVVLDPGHGGIDPGAQSGAIKEADLMLTLAQELADALERSGNIEAYLTRQGDQFVSLERRVKIARAYGADLFISLHADALASGKAHGAAVYTLSNEASDKASAALAERHNRTDLLAGVDLSGQDDQVAAILMELARLENRPRSEALARGIILGINTAVGHTYKRPIQSAGFSVLKAADIPSVLVEVGFLSSADDLGKLLDPVWRGKLVQGIRDGVLAWRLTDGADAQLRRK